MPFQPPFQKTHDIQKKDPKKFLESTKGIYFMKNVWPHGRKMLYLDISKSSYKL